MADTIRIQMMNSFTIYVNERRAEQMVNKSRKGVALMQYLILNQGQPVSNSDLLSELWSDESGTNPENALKTLISRMRVLLNQVSDGLGKCIVADRGAYHWECRPGMTIDVYEIESIFDQLNHSKNDHAVCQPLYQQLMKLYQGDLNADISEWMSTRATAMHNHYIEAIYSYVEMLKAEDNFEEVVNVCRSALDVDNFDERLHTELMSALVKTNHTSEAMVQYRHIVHMHYRYLGVQPSDDLQEFYKQIAQANRSLEITLESIRKELSESDNQRGAFVCDYAVFKEIFNLQIRNLERLGSTMFLAVIMVAGNNGKAMDIIKQDNIMSGLQDILKVNLRKGDTITQYSPTHFVMLLPTVDYDTSTNVIERVKRLFYRRYPNSNVTFNYRVGPLASNMQLPDAGIGTKE